MEVRHVPVLLAETLEYLAPERGGVFVDGTVGLGGHAEALLGAPPDVQLLGIDRDREARARAAERLAGFGPRVRLVQANFHQLMATLAGLGVRAIAGFLADLGVSSLQLETPGRGFSFRFDGPLDMRMGLSETTAADLVNQASEGELATIFRDYGEERHARRIGAGDRPRPDGEADQDHGRAQGPGGRRQGRAGPPRGADRPGDAGLPGPA